MCWLCTTPTQCYFDWQNDNNKKRKEDENRRRRLKLLRQSNWSYLLYRVHFNLDTNQKIWSEKNLAQLFWGYLIFCCVRCTFEISPPPRKSIWILKKKVDWETRHDDDKHQKLWSPFWSRVLPENKKKKRFFKKTTRRWIWIITRDSSEKILTRKEILYLWNRIKVCVCVRVRYVVT